MNHISQSFRDITLKENNVKYEFQQVGIEMCEEFGKEFNRKIWPLFYKSKYTTKLIRDVFYQYKKQPIKSFNYFMGMLNNKSK